ncbi:hypothetical protein H4582DRAFT_1815587, partial [Lactarius indigo]
FYVLRGFEVIGQLIAHSELKNSGIRLPVHGLSVTGSLEEAELGIPPASLQDVQSDEFVMGACLDSDLGVETAEPVVERPLTAIGRAAVEVTWLGCTTLMTFCGPQSQGSFSLRYSLSQSAAHITTIILSSCHLLYCR